MKKILIILVGIWITYAIFSGDDSTSPSRNLSVDNKQTTSALPRACNQEASITGEQLNVIGTGINVRTGPGTTFEKVINQKASAILDGTHYVSIDDSTIVFEECTNGDWSWVRVVEPDYLQDSHRGWVLSNFLDKGQNLGGDPYARKISSSAITPYDEKNYPKTVKIYGSRLEEIEKLRRRAAEMAVDSGKCDFAQWVELSDSRSTLEHLHFWIDCRNGQRIYLDEFEINQNGQVLTQQDQAWNESSAASACIAAIKDRALLPSKVDIHTLLGTSMYTAPITFNVVITMDFDAKNALGLELPYTAKCYFEPGEVGEIEINERR